MKDHIESSHLTMFDAFRINIRQVTDLYILFLVVVIIIIIIIIIIIYFLLTLLSTFSYKLESYMYLVKKFRNSVAEKII